MSMVSLFFEGMQTVMIWLVAAATIYNSVTLIGMSRR